MKLLKVFFVLLFILSQHVGSGQVVEPEPTDPGCDPLDPYCPIDGGLSLLIAAAIGVGAKTAYDAKKKHEVSSTTSL